ncbi:MAG: DUF938 domain-containing protein [Bacteriovoracaceae bacterium]
MEKPFSPASARNKEPILEKFLELTTVEDRAVLEVGSGTGQHGIYFSQKLPHIKWTFSDVETNHPGIQMWMKEEGDGHNLKGPISYEVGKDEFPEGNYDIVFTANTLHIMSWKLVKTLIKALGNKLEPGARVLIYGPFNYHGNFTSKSNKDFDQMLSSRDPLSGIRSFEDVKKQMEQRGFRLLKDYEMPANNHLLAFIKI